MHVHLVPTPACVRPCSRAGLLAWLLLHACACMCVHVAGAAPDSVPTSTLEFNATEAQLQLELNFTSDGAAAAAATPLEAAMSYAVSLVGTPYGTLFPI